MGDRETPPPDPHHNGNDADNGDRVVFLLFLVVLAALSTGLAFGALLDWVRR